jgi:RNA polymerase sigma factor (TIGR02999 family)
VDDGLLAQIYDQLRGIAQAKLRDERAGHSLQPTELVHEAYLRLQNHPSIAEAGRVRFLHAAAEAMRRILIDHARARGRAKRGGGMKRSIVDVSDLAALENPADVLNLNEAIQRLEQIEPRAAMVLKLRFFAGLSVEETAEALSLSGRTVKREWQFARAWLFRDIQR